MSDDSESDEGAHILNLHQLTGYQRLYAGGGKEHYEGQIRKGLNYFSETRFETMDALLVSILDDTFISTYERAVSARACLSSFQNVIECERNGQSGWEKKPSVEGKKYSPPPAQLAYQNLANALITLKEALLEDKPKNKEVLEQVRVLGDFISVLSEYQTARRFGKHIRANPADGVDDPHTIMMTRDL